MNDYGDGDMNSNEPEGRGPWYEDARRRVQTPGMILMVLGGLSLFVTIAYLGLLFAAPDVALRGQYDFMVDLQKDQPNAKPLPPYDEFVKTQQMQSGIFQIVAVAGSILIFLAGSKMRQLQSYSLCMVGSILAILPTCTNNCCCLTVPFGIWAIVVLLNSDVKLAFAKTAAASVEPLE